MPCVRSQVPKIGVQKGIDQFDDAVTGFASGDVICFLFQCIDRVSNGD